MLVAPAGSKEAVGVRVSPRLLAEVGNNKLEASEPEEVEHD